MLRGERDDEKTQALSIMSSFILTFVASLLEFARSMEKKEGSAPSNKFEEETMEVRSLGMR